MNPTLDGAKLYVYSGDYRLGEVGQETPFQDCNGRPLFVGDIVLTFTDNYMPDSLTAVVSDEFTTYSDGTHKVKDGPVEHFVMGIRSVDLKEPKQWRVKKVKDYDDVIVGENWPEWGFSYRQEAE